MAHSAPGSLDSTRALPQVRLLYILDIVAYLAMVALNVIAVTLPLNALETGEVSAMFPSLFTPAGYVFSIWSLIYLGLGVFVVYKLLPGQRYNPRLARLGPFFILSCALNIAWLFAWHYLQITLTLPLMLGLLATLIVCYHKLGTGRSEVSLRESLAVRLPFSLYLGWITVATVANVSVFLLDLGVRVTWFTPAWALLAIIAATCIGVLMVRQRGDVTFALVLVWAFVGIAVRQWGTEALLMIGALTAAIYLGSVAFRQVQGRRTQG